MIRSRAATPDAYMETTQTNQTLTDLAERTEALRRYL